MKRAVLQAVLSSIEARESVAVISITEATGDYAAQIGRHLALWLEEEHAPVGDLTLGALDARLHADARSALAERAHRRFSYQTDDGEVKAFVEVQAQPPHLIIVGAGHIAVPLAAIAKLNDFEVTVLDDRAQYAQRSRFPTVD